VEVLTLALGTGANATIHQLLTPSASRALAVKAPEQLAIVELADTTRWVAAELRHPVLSNPLWEHFRDHQNIFSGVLAWANTELQLDRSLGTPVARGLLVSGDFFGVLGVEAHTGRTFTAGDDRPGCGVPGAVVSYGFWQRYLGGDPAAVGRTLALNSRSVEVIGVTAPGFSGAEVGRAFDVAVPICSQAALGGEAGWLGDGTVWWLTVMGRMPADRSLDSVNTQLDSASPGLFEASLPANYPPNLVKDYLGFRLRATPGGTGVSALRRRYADPLLLLQLCNRSCCSSCTNLASPLPGPQRGASSPSDWQGGPWFVLSGNSRSERRDRSAGSLVLRVSMVQPIALGIGRNRR
jgi:hypothetical protein